MVNTVDDRVFCHGCFAGMSEGFDIYTNSEYALDDNQRCPYDNGNEYHASCHDHVDRVTQVQYPLQHETLF